MSNESVVRRLREDIARFDEGSLSVSGIQAAIWDHGAALDGLGNEWLDLLNIVVGRIEIHRFLVEGDDVVGAVRPEIARIESFLSDRGL